MTDRACRTGAKLHIEGTPHNWSEQGYLAANPDVAALIAEGKVQNGFDHYRSAGFFEFRLGGFPGLERESISGRRILMSCR